MHFFGLKELWEDTQTVRGSSFQLTILSICDSRCNFGGLLTCTVNNEKEKCKNIRSEVSSNLVGGVRLARKASDAQIGP